MAVKKESAITVALGSVIRVHRHLLGLSQEELAHRCRLHRTYVADVERGNRNPSLLALEKIATGLEAQLSELFSDVERHRGGKAKP